MSYGVKPDVTTLDDDLRLLRDSKFSAETVDQIKTWLYAVLNEAAPKGPLLEQLHDGVVLCRLANALLSADDNNAQLLPWKQSRMPFVQMEHISRFLTFARAYGVPEDELFQTVDLYEQKDPASVYLSFIALSRYAHRRHPELFPVIGPQLARKRPPPRPKPNHLRAAAWSTQEYGYMGGANQSTERVVFGRRRNINPDDR
ncbi:ADR409Wp [Eremothecium gossypii ATCC 10895]|uniref:ADR409Wp n=1 Tax=Eremothecium gossypii (strain ATCC 10895 / CBS 109.51 / FGSC 9923 / NRRL Y-1056) TaxID=284811 RepID=Q758W9_EREGS|nr:ADR409Wp [Eremothecium gossypii ATCC 10895]AAS52328.2 ADR409Wp [Eremothecium gossypii ATCC 10895]AEY96625.1 FADR409Wp [Eremothecium gossypii FDAG1]